MRFGTDKLYGYQWLYCIALQHAAVVVVTFYELTRKLVCTHHHEQHLDVGYCRQFGNDHLCELVPLARSLKSLRLRGTCVSDSGVIRSLMDMSALENPITTRLPLEELDLSAVEPPATRGGYISDETCSYLVVSAHQMMVLQCSLSIGVCVCVFAFVCVCVCVCWSPVAVQNKIPQYWILFHFIVATVTILPLLLVDRSKSKCCNPRNSPTQSSWASLWSPKHTCTCSTCCSASCI